MNLILTLKGNMGYRIFYYLLFLSSLFGCVKTVSKTVYYEVDGMYYNAINSDSLDLESVIELKAYGDITDDIPFEKMSSLESIIFVESDMEEMWELASQRTLDISDSICYLKQLRALGVDGYNFTLPNCVDELHKLEKLIIETSNFDTLTIDLKLFSSVKWLTVFNCEINVLRFENDESLNNIEFINLGSTNIKNDIIGMNKLKGLKALVVPNTDSTLFDKSILRDVATIDFSFLNIDSIDTRSFINEINSKRVILLSEQLSSNPLLTNENIHEVLIQDRNMLSENQMELYPQRVSRLKANNSEIKILDSAGN